MRISSKTNPFMTTLEKFSPEADLDEKGKENINRLLGKSIKSWKLVRLQNFAKVAPDTLHNYLTWPRKIPGTDKVMTAFQWFLMGYRKAEYPILEFINIKYPAMLSDALRDGKIRANLYSSKKGDLVAHLPVEWISTFAKETLNLANTPFVKTIRNDLFQNDKTSETFLEVPENRKDSSLAEMTAAPAPLVTVSPSPTPLNTSTSATLRYSQTQEPFSTVQCPQATGTTFSSEYSGFNCQTSMPHTQYPGTYFPPYTMPPLPSGFVEYDYSTQSMPNAYYTQYFPAPDHSLGLQPPIYQPRYLGRYPQPYAQPSSGSANYDYSTIQCSQGTMSSCQPNHAGIVMTQVPAVPPSWPENTYFNELYGEPYNN